MAAKEWNASKCRPLCTSVRFFFGSKNTVNAKTLAGILIPVIPTKTVLNGILLELRTKSATNSANSVGVAQMFIGRVLNGFDTPVVPIFGPEPKPTKLEIFPWFPPCFPTFSHENSHISRTPEERQRLAPRNGPGAGGDGGGVCHGVSTCSVSECHMGHDAMY